MYEILIRTEFSGAHHLRGYKGKCEALHGHNWKVEAKFQKEGVDALGISYDFKKAKDMLKSILKKFDHAYLNKLSAFKTKNPSAENIARYIYKELKNSITQKGLAVASVSVWESDSSCATYFE